jgi:hypothetical protein
VNVGEPPEGWCLPRALAQSQCCVGAQRMGHEHHLVALIGMWGQLRAQTP